MLILCRSGFKVEEMWDEISDVVGHVDIVVLHCGANNLSRWDPYEHLVSNLS